MIIMITRWRMLPEVFGLGFRCMVFLELQGKRQVQEGRLVPHELADRSVLCLHELLEFFDFCPDEKLGSGIHEVHVSGQQRLESVQK
jgi:hypothetical protein